jgi:hypothetical protein
MNLESLYNRVSGGSIGTCILKDCSNRSVNNNANTPCGDDCVKEEIIGKYASSCFNNAHFYNFSTSGESTGTCIFKECGERSVNSSDYWRFFSSLYSSSFNNNNNSNYNSNNNNSSMEFEFCRHTLSSILEGLKRIR